MKTFLNKHLFSAMKVLFLGLNDTHLIDEYREKYVDAYACLKIEHPFVYQQNIRDIHFPTDYFDAIVYYSTQGFCLKELKEIKRILKSVGDDGKLILHSSKNIKKEIYDILIKMDFTLEVIQYTEKTGTIVLARKPIQIRPKLLFPPGIGDSYWVLTKLQSFLKRENLSLPDIYIVGREDNKYHSHTRTFPFLEMFPFLNTSWKYIDYDKASEETAKIWIEAYEEKGRTIFPNILGSDYFFCYNGYINNGVALEEVDPDLQCNWFPDMFVSLHQKQYGVRAKIKYNKYILFSFGFRGTYTYWANEFSAKDVSNYINKVIKETNLTPILVGARWDAEDVGVRYILDNTDCIDLLGLTTVEELFGLIKNSECVVGWPSGLTMFSPVLGQKALVIWNDLYSINTFWNVVPPATRNKTYFIKNTKDITVDSLANTTFEILAK